MQEVLHSSAEMQIEAQKQHKEIDSVHKTKVHFCDSEVKQIFIF